MISEKTLGQAFSLMAKQCKATEESECKEIMNSLHCKNLSNEVF